jgi:hypothetical protein
MILFQGRRKLARNTKPPTTPCKYCNKMGHSSTQCTAKETGTILILHNLLKDLLLLPSVPISLVSKLRNQAAPITIQRILEHYDNFDEDSEDELDKASNSKVAQNLSDEQSAVATSAGTTARIEEQNQKSEDYSYCPHQSPQPTQPSIASTGDNRCNFVYYYYPNYLRIIHILCSQHS